MGEEDLCKLYPGSSKPYKVKNNERRRAEQCSWCVGSVWGRGVWIHVKSENRCVCWLIFLKTKIEGSVTNENGFL